MITKKWKKLESLNHTFFGHLKLHLDDKHKKAICLKKYNLWQLRMNANEIGSHKKHDTSREGNKGIKEN